MDRRLLAYELVEIAKRLTAEDAKAMVKSAVKSLIPKVTVGITPQNKVIIFMSRDYDNKGKVTGPFEDVTKIGGKDGFYMLSEEYDDAALDELGYDKKDVKKLLSRAKRFASKHKASHDSSLKGSNCIAAKGKWSQVKKELADLKKKSKSGYNKLMEEWRDSLPHTGKKDVLLGSPRLEEFIDENPEEAEDLIDDIRRFKKAQSTVANELVKLAKELTAKKVEISNRLYNRAMNRGAELTIPWPERALGEYGSGDASDRDMDRWVSDNVEMPEYPVVVTGVGAGRTHRGDPVIIVHLGTDPSGWKTEDGVMYPGSRSDAVGRKLPREVQASDARTANQEKAWQMLTGNKIGRIFDDISSQAKDLEIVLSNIQADARRAEGVSGETDAEEWLSQLHDEVESFAKFVNKVESQIAKALR